MFTFGDHVKLASHVTDNDCAGVKGIVTRAYPDTTNPSQWLVDVAFENGVVNRGLRQTSLESAKPFMTHEQWSKRAERWSKDDLTDERALGRLEGQLQAFEMYLLRLTAMHLSTERVIEMLDQDIKGFDAMLDAEPRLRYFRVDSETAENGTFKMSTADVQRALRSAVDFYENEGFITGDTVTLLHVAVDNMLRSRPLRKG